MPAPFEPLRGDDVAYGDDAVEISVTGSVADGTRHATLVPRSLRNLDPELRELVTATTLAAAAYEDAFAALAEAVGDMRDGGLSWDAVGWCVGTTGSGARKRFGP